MFNVKDFNNLDNLPDWAVVLGWMMTVSPIVVVTIVGFIVLARSYRDPDYSGLSFARVRRAYYIYIDAVEARVLGNGVA